MKSEKLQKKKHLKRQWTELSTNSHANRYTCTKYTRAQTRIPLFLFCLHPLPVFTETTFKCSHCVRSGFMLFSSFTLPRSLINKQLKKLLQRRCQRNTSAAIEMRTRTNKRMRSQVSCLCASVCLCFLLLFFFLTITKISCASFDTTNITIEEDFTLTTLILKVFYISELTIVEWLLLHCATNRSSAIVQDVYFYMVYSKFNFY